MIVSSAYKFKSASETLLSTSLKRIARPQNLTLWNPSFNVQVKALISSTEFLQSRAFIISLSILLAAVSVL